MFSFLNRFRTKTVYFVRHGETVLNAAKIRQGSEGGLSDKGKLQVQAQAERLKIYTIDIILASPFERTRETAAIINKSLNKKIEFNPLLAERRNPSEIIGKSADDPEVRHIVDVIDKSLHEGGLRYSDEENFEDLKKRAHDLLEYLAHRPERNILCVTHGIFLTMVIAYIQFGEALTAQRFVELSFFNPTNNAAITVCGYNPRKKRFNNGWQLRAWNDYARLIKQS